MANPLLTAVVALTALLAGTGCLRAATAPVPHGRALCIGVSKLSQAGYPDKPPELPGAKNDEQAMALLLKNRGFDVHELRDENATTGNLIKELNDAKSSFGPEESGLFVISFSGHGSQVTDVNHDEASGLDDTWCLYDLQFIDDQLFAALHSFPSTVRILMISDSCHSGTMIQLAPDLLSLNINDSRLEPFRKSEKSQLSLPQALDGKDNALKEPPGTIVRSLSVDQKIRAYQANEAVYADVQKKLGDPKVWKVNPWDPNHPSPNPPHILSITACEDNETAGEVDGHGIFTTALVSVWNSGAFDQDQRMFRKAVEVAAWNVRNFQNAAIVAFDSKFEHEQPFSIAGQLGVVPATQPNTK